jgi:hypothetical protein
MRLAAWQLASRCDRVVTVDLLWPPYRKILEDVCRESGTRLRIIRLRNAVRHHRASPPWITELVCDACTRFGAHGVMLPILTHHGVRLPLQAIASRLRQQLPSLFVAVDGAQAFGHLPVQFSREWCDLFIAGTHKWLGGYHPLGIGISTDPTIKHEIASHLSKRRLDDPLIRLCGEFDGTAGLRHGETTCMAPLLSAQGAITDALQCDERTRLAGRLSNRRGVSRLLRRERWQVLHARESHTHGILHARPPVSGRISDPESMRRVFRSHHVAVTVYSNSTVRLSLPARHLPTQSQQQLQAALHEIAA